MTTGLEQRDSKVAIVIDGKEYEAQKPTLTGGEIMDMGGIPRSVGLLQVKEEGAECQVGEQETIELRPGHRFKKPPHFKRG